MKLKLTRKTMTRVLTTRKTMTILTTMNKRSKTRKRTKTPARRMEIQIQFFTAVRR